MRRTIKLESGERCEIEINRHNYYHSDRYDIYEIDNITENELYLLDGNVFISDIPSRTKVVVLRERKEELDDGGNLRVGLKEDYVIGYVYVVKLDKHYKIGISKSPETRLKEFTLLPYELEHILIAKIKGYEVREKELHEHFADKRVRGEWFELNEEDIEYIKEYLKEYEVE